ncbi:MAG: hypothetical protein LC658_12195, partial [Bacteroidales bacterium]|nr:hypothetical protein [Bacteroidales bacterium]
DKHLTGKVFFARELMGIVVDSTGTLDDAINRASVLAGERKNNRESGNSAKESDDNQSIHFLNMKQFENVNAALGVESLESVDGVVSLNQDQLEALDNKLGENNAEALQSQLDAAGETVKQHEATISERDAAIAEKDNAIAEKETEIARLKGKAAGGNATAKTDGDDKDLKKGNAKTVVSDSDDFETAVQKVSDEYLKNY